MSPAPDAGERGARASSRRRLFFALWLDERSRARLTEAAAPLLGRVVARALSPLDWHLTLCFLGDVEDTQVDGLTRGAAQIAARLAAHPCELLLERVHYWRPAQVVAASAATVPPSLLELAQALRVLARVAGVQPDDKPLRLHVTLMRGVSAAVWHQSTHGAQRELSLNLTVPADELQLAESLPTPHGGRRYAPLARWSLRG